MNPPNLFGVWIWYWTLTYSILCYAFLKADGAGRDETSPNQTKCSGINESSRCKAIVSSPRSVPVVCKITQSCELGKLMADKTNVTHLYLSNNHLQELPDGFLAHYTHLRYLSLAYNNISVLKYQVFKGLNNLTTLRLSHNPLRSMTGNLSGLFPSLSVLYVTGIEDWILEKQLLRLPKLKRISHVVLPSLKSNGFCRYCSFVFNNVSWSPVAPYIVRFSCYLIRNSVNNLSVVAQFLNGSYFHIRCNNYNRFRCKKSDYYDYHYENTCWKETLAAVNCQSFVGFLAALLNLLVFLNILTSKRLRKNVSMCFVCNMAFCDFLLGVYIVRIGIYLNSAPFSYIYHNSQAECFKIGFLWMLGQAGAVLTSFLLTVERYLVIVYSLKPNVRITRRMAVILIAVCWLIACFLTVWAMYYNFYIRTFLCIPIKLNIRIVNLFVFTVTIGSVAVLLYLSSFVLYIRIFITVKRSAQNASVKRESKLAKRISLLVASNVFFFVVPVLLVAIFYISGAENIIRMASGSLIMDMLTPFCLSFNSCLNPIIHAFRTDSFKQVMKERLSVMRDHYRSLLALFRGFSLRLVRVNSSTTKGSENHAMDELGNRNQMGEEEENI